MLFPNAAEIFIPTLIVESRELQVCFLIIEEQILNLTRKQQQQQPQLLLLLLVVAVAEVISLTREIEIKKVDKNLHSLHRNTNQRKVRRSQLVFRLKVVVVVVVAVVVVVPTKN